MKIVTISPQTNEVREKFFKDIFQDETGYICIAIAVHKKNFREEFFRYPEDLGMALELINRSYHGQNIYFCPQLLREPNRQKASVKTCTCIWADLDACSPDLVMPPPTIALETSPNRWQGFWVLEEALTPVDAEDISHRLAHAYESYGVDQSGWDLTQLLRVPLTYNAKYQTMNNVPVVNLISNTGVLYKAADFADLPQVAGYEWVEEPIPDVEDIDPDKLLEKYRKKVDPQVIILHGMEPKSDWSSALWNLNCLLLEAGISKEETFAIARTAACNKFARDGLEDKYLWQDVCRAAARIYARVADATLTNRLEPLLTDEERELVKNAPNTFVEDYVEWAKSRGDAAWQYHQTGAFVILSQLLSGVVKLPTSFGVIVPNLWFMILADTTLTRKSTAMDMAVEMLLTVDPDAVLATDGSLEGLMSGISVRPNRPGIFWRDEFSGLLEMIRKKDYYAGMIESLTKLYDGKYQKRMLRKEVIEIRDPILIIYCGGIRSRILSQMDIEFVLSGFMPRFIFVQAESDLNNFKPIGPMTDNQDSRREVLMQQMAKIKESYEGEMSVTVGDTVITTKRTWNAILAPEVWDRYNQFEKAMVEYGVESPKPEVYTPVLDRLSKSGLKAATLLAASRQQPGEHVLVQMEDLLRAIGYVETWREFSLDVAANVGKTANEKQLDLVLMAVRKNPGVSRAKVMQNYHLTAREADWILETLDQRGLVRRIRSGKSEHLHPALIR